MGGGGGGGGKIKCGTCEMSRGTALAGGTYLGWWEKSVENYFLRPGSKLGGVLIGVRAGEGITGSTPDSRQDRKNNNGELVKEREEENIPESTKSKETQNQNLFLLGTRAGNSPADGANQLYWDRKRGRRTFQLRRDTDNGGTRHTIKKINRNLGKYRSRKSMQGELPPRHLLEGITTGRKNCDPSQGTKTANGKIANDIKTLKTFRCPSAGNRVGCPRKGERRLQIKRGTPG